MKTPKFTTIVELLDPDIKRNQVGWCQIYSKGVPGSSDAECWSVYPKPISATIWSVQFLSPHAPVLDFLGKRIELHKVNKLIGYVTIIEEEL